MRLIERVGQQISGRPKAAWSQPPFWKSLDSSLFVGSLNPSEERIGVDFEDLVEGAFKSNGTVFACILARQWVFSEVRFQYRRFEGGRPQALFGGTSLGILEKPWLGGTTGELLARMEQDASLAGNFWATLADNRGRIGRAARGGPGERIVRLRPDRVRLVIASHSGNPHAADAKVVSIIYRAPATEHYPEHEVALFPDEVVHYSPIPDPLARFRGMSWLTPLIREIEADKLATTHKAKFFENAAVPNFAVKFDKETGADEFEEFVEGFKEHHQGAWNAYKTLFLMGGADIEPLTVDLKQLEFSQTQGKGESRIAAAAGVPPSWVGFSEGLQGSSLNAGNFTAARRRFADGTIRPLWRMAAASLEVILDVEDDGRELWYDARDVAFLREDLTDVAEIQSKQAVALRALTDAGYAPDASVQFLQADDLGQLIGQHTGLFSVQLQPPGSEDAKDGAQNSAQNNGPVTVRDAATLTDLMAKGWTVVKEQQHEH